MEPQSNLSDLQSLPIPSCINPPEGFVPRYGQALGWKAVESPDGNSHLFVLPTGYGKTAAAVGAYIVARAAGRVNRLLVVVPSDEQRTQWNAEAGKWFERLGAEGGASWIITRRPVDFRYLNNPDYEVFVATIHQLNDQREFWDDFLSRHTWYAIFDECHHNSQEGSWGKTVASLDVAERLSLSAEPIRRDNQLLAGVPYRVRPDGTHEIVPTVEVSYRKALEEGAIRSVDTHRAHYLIDVEDGEGNKERIATDDLARRGVDPDAYEKKKGLRYVKGYLSPILLDAFNELNDRNARPGHAGEHQMLLFAMTCLHAEHVASVLNDLAGEEVADWIGTHRNSKENARILRSFKAGRLPCLVQVAMAGEGFDLPRISVLVFVHLVNSRQFLLQQIGRGLRRNRALGADDVPCAVYASSDSEVARLAAELEQEAVDLGIRPPEAKEVARELGDIPFRDIPAFSVVAAQLERIDLIRSGQSVANERHLAKGMEMLRKASIDPGLLTPDAIARLGEQLIYTNGSSPARATVETETDRHHQARELVKKAVTTVTGNTLRATSGRAAGGNAGRLKQLIHGEWKRRGGRGHDAMTAEELERKHRWLQELNDSVKRGEVPSWLTELT